jgi:hypothetical protein
MFGILQLQPCLFRPAMPQPLVPEAPPQKGQEVKDDRTSMGSATCCIASESVPSFRATARPKSPLPQQRPRLHAGLLLGEAVLDLEPTRIFLPVCCCAGPHADHIDWCAVVGSGE